ncbi:Putative Na+/H+ antiporter [Duganella sp. CF517]|uniref:putative Na+/H+ antiporter n=1 Tax=Duganella sp. CF517 TaxID=1881038 RepID=UPI0008C10B10|nr:putative Na+/H+ antiporter [Duganella sp. CF517]SEN36599.1 Putative Na+/H+ antiporter [Duganella sp. CF517]
MHTIQLVGAVLFGLALLHTFAAKTFGVLARRHPRHAGLFHLLGEVEVVFGFWAFVLIAALAVLDGPGAAIAYAETRHYAEPLFVFTVMVVAASRPVLDIVRRALRAVAARLPLSTDLALSWFGLALVPLTGSLITEPAAMTLAALMLAPLVFRRDLPEWLKYGALGALFVNVSIGGTLTAYAAPPVLMVATTWQWDSLYMATRFGWKAALAVALNAGVVCFLLRPHLRAPAGAPAPGAPSRGVPAPDGPADGAPPVPWPVTLIHLGFLAGVVVLGHHPVLFLGLFMLFLGFATAYQRYQHPLIIKEGLLVGFFLAGLVVLGGMQQWWLQPIVASLSPLALFFGALGLTAITDNAALTYLGSLIEGISAPSQYMLMAGAVAGGGLTVIANAPNPAGAALLRRGFRDESIGAVGLLLGALGPTVVAAAAFLLL